MRPGVDDGDVMFMWLGSDVEESYWMDLFDISNPHDLKPIPVGTSGHGLLPVLTNPPLQRRLPELPNPYSIRVRQVIAHLEQQTGITRRFIVVRQNLDALEIDFANMLMEDTNNDGMSYLDCEFKPVC